MNTLLIVLFTMVGTTFALIKFQQHFETQLDKAFEDVIITKKKPTVEAGEIDWDFERYVSVMAPSNKREYNEVTRRYKNRKMS